jgi:ubiquinone/menaquinone biosynthesis C-methylase UbiE
MNKYHEANRRHWDNIAVTWRELRDRDGLWKRCAVDPELAFEGEAFGQIRRFYPDLHGRRACVIGSGDNYAAFALAGLGARVTSVDISQRQLDVAEDRARMLGLDLAFVRADATELNALEQTGFDLVVSTNGFFVWISDPAALFRAVYAVLKRSGVYVFYDIHPFQRPWADNADALVMEKPYADGGPYVFSDEGTSYEYHWTFGALLNAMTGAGLVLRHVGETGPKDSRFWQDFSYEPGSAEVLLDWRRNPRAGLPTWLTVAAQKP